MGRDRCSPGDRGPSVVAGAQAAGVAATTVLIVDDHGGFRATARRMLEAEGYQVVGEAADGCSAISAVCDLKPALVLLDVQLPDLDGFEVAARLTAAGEAPEIVLISSHDSSDFGPLVARSGACGFVSKEELSGPAIEATRP